MSDASSAQLADLYQRYRLADQRRFYRRRALEFRRARNQARITAASLLVLASVAGALGSADVAGWRTTWAVMATALGALAAALTSYEAAYSFDRLSREYDQTDAGLAVLEARLPGQPCGPLVGDAEVAAFVERAEALLISEVDRWSRHTAETPPPEDEPSTPPGG